MSEQGYAVKRSVDIYGTYQMSILLRHPDGVRHR
jgi:hypothetical protein